MDQGVTDVERIRMECDRMKNGKSKAILRKKKKGQI